MYRIRLSLRSAYYTGLREAPTKESVSTVSARYIYLEGQESVVL